MKHLFIVNPIAGGRKSDPEKVVKTIKDAMAHRDEQYEIYLTAGPMDACSRIEEAAKTEDDLRVYACGGDGTLNECVNGAACKKNVAVTVYPCGTGNDYIKIFGEEKQRFFDLEALISGEIRDTDVINCNGRYSANICSVGLDARIGVDVHKYSKIPVIGGATAYVVSTAVNFVKDITTQLAVKADGYERSGKTALVCACNGAYYGGGFHPVPEARPDDGVMDVLVVGDVSRFNFLTLIGKYATGKYAQLKKFIKHMRVTHLEIEGEEDMVVSVDGEAIYGKKIVFDLIPGGMRFIYPKGMKYFNA